MAEQRAMGDSPHVSAIHGLLLAMVPALVVLTVVAPLPIVPNMAADFVHRDPTGSLVSFALTAPILAIAVISVLLGFVGDRVSRRAMLIGGSAVFAVVAPAPLITEGLFAIIATRLVTGAALGCMLTAAVGLTGDYFEGKRRAFWLSMQGTFPAATAIGASALAGFLGEMGWRTPFGMLLIGFVFVLVLVSIRAPLITPEEPISEPGRVPAGTSSDLWRSLMIVFVMAIALSLIVFPAAYEFGYLLAERDINSVVLTGAMTSVLGTGAVAGAYGLNLLSRVSPLGRLSFALAGGALGYAIVGLAGQFSVLAVGAAIIGFGQGLVVPALSLWLLDKAGPSGRGKVIGPFQAILYFAQFAAPLVARQASLLLGSSTAFFQTYGSLAAALGAALILFLAVSRRSAVPVRD